MEKLQLNWLIDKINNDILYIKKQIEILNNEYKNKKIKLAEYKVLIKERLKKIKELEKEKKIYEKFLKIKKEEK